VVLAASELLRGDGEAALPLAVAVELVHAASPTTSPRWTTPRCAAAARRFTR
jgi:hypothetical protein